MATSTPSFPTRQITPLDEEVEEEWTREISNPHDDDIHGVGATRSPDDEWPWRVTVSVMEFIRGVPLEGELRRRIPASLRAVPGVIEVAEEDREVWIVRGTPTGAALVDAVAAVVDELAPKTRAHIDSL